MWTIYDFRNESGSKPHEARAIDAMMVTREQDKTITSTAKQILFLVEGADTMERRSGSCRHHGLN